MGLPIVTDGELTGPLVWQGTNAPPTPSAAEEALQQLRETRPQKRVQEAIVLRRRDDDISISSDFRRGAQAVLFVGSEDVSAWKMASVCAKGSVMVPRFYVDAGYGQESRPVCRGREGGIDPDTRRAPRRCRKEPLGRAPRCHAITNSASASKRTSFFRRPWYRNRSFPPLPAAAASGQRALSTDVACRLAGTPRSPRRAFVVFSASHYAAQDGSAALVLCPAPGFQGAGGDRDSLVYRAGKYRKELAASTNLFASFDEDDLFASRDEHARNNSISALLVCTCWFLVVDAHAGQPVTDFFLHNGVTAHRGNSGEFPENTLAAFQSGIAIGADWIELDVFRTKDGILVVTHDETTERVGDQNLVVADSTYEQLLAVDVATDFRQRNNKSIETVPKHTIPLLEEVLRLVMTQHKTRVSIQPKMDCVADAIHLVKTMGAEKWVGFNDGSLQFMAEVKRLSPDIPVFWDRGESDVTEDIRIAKQHGFEFLVLHHSVITKEKIDQIHEAGLQAGAWTVNDEAMMARLLKLGIDRIYTDYPKQLLHQLDLAKRMIGLAGGGHTPTAWQMAGTFPFAGARRTTFAGRSNCLDGELARPSFTEPECSSLRKWKKAARSHF